MGGEHGRMRDTNKCAQTGSEKPHRRERKFQFYFNLTDFEHQIGRSGIYDGNLWLWCEPRAL